MKIELSKEDYEFLKELRDELNTQDNDGNADPVFWGVMEDREVFVPEGCGEEKIAYDDGMMTLEEAVAEINGSIDEFGQELKEEWAEVDKECAYDVCEFMKERLGWDAIHGVYDTAVEQVLSRNTGAFITKRACKEYIEKYKYNHNNPRTYAMTAFRNYELGRLLTILKNLKFED